MAMTFGEKRPGKADGGASMRPRPVTPEWMFRAAAHYLERYASTAENLRRVLQRKISRRLQGAAPSEEDSDAAEVTLALPDHAAMIEETIARFVELKLLDDEAFAQARFSSLRRRGTSLRQAEAKLSQKGVDRETIADVLAADETGDRAAAHAYAKRRRLGPHRLRDRQARRDRDVAAMMRAGFGYRDAMVAIDGDGDGAGDGEDEAGS